MTCLENAIELKHITKTYEDGFTAVSDFNLEIKRGEFVTFLGPSGCGKTTVGRTLLRLYTPTAGTVKFEGEEVTAKIVGFEMENKKISLSVKALLEPEATEEAAPAEEAPVAE